MGLPAGGAPMTHKEKLWRSRLAEWRVELQTNQHGMAHLAPRCIALLESEITEFWGAPQRRAEAFIDSTDAATTPESGGTLP